MLADRLAHLTVGHVLETAAGTIWGRQCPAFRVRWRQADAQALPFADQTFDAVICQLGVMFFPDRHSAFNEARRVLKPGGRLLFSAWDGLESNSLGHIAHQAVFTLFPTLPHESALAPYVYRDPHAIEAELSRAGFDDTHIETVTGVSRAGSAGDVAYAMCQGGVMRGVVETLGPGRLDEATEAVTRVVAARLATGPSRHPIRPCW